MSEPNPAPSAPDPAIAILIDRACAQHAAIALQLLDFQTLTSQIVALGKGKHTGANPAHVVTVVAAYLGSEGEITYDEALTPESLAQARLIAGLAFSNLFDRVISYVPCKGFGDVTPKLLTPAKARHILTLCAVRGKGSAPKKPYILWPK
jgi:hypothetical protein